MANRLALACGNGDSDRFKIEAGLRRVKKLKSYVGYYGNFPM
jgi:hypothetical protein